MTLTDKPLKEPLGRVTRRDALNAMLAQSGDVAPIDVPLHPSDGPTGHELYFMCDDLEATVGDLQAEGVEFTQGVSEERWGRLTRFRLPGGGEVGM
jgi:predicted enzyme related to lactoylglutathione lyase